jgi:hypothetical protein
VKNQGSLLSPDTALRSNKTEPKRKKCQKIRCVCPDNLATGRVT